MQRSASDERASLAPERPRPRTPEEIAAILGLDLSGEGGRALRGCVQRITSTFVESFPGNLFLDLDLLVGVLARLSVAELDGSTELVCRLSVVFGAPPLRFRYAHDFLYGFDWCRWVAKVPEERAGIGPFDRPFLEYTLARAEELKGLIERGDSKYHAIDPDAFRNPFGFSREPDEERALFTALSARGLLPVEAFEVEGRARWDLPYASLREDVARELGIRCREVGTAR